MKRTVLIGLLSASTLFFTACGTKTNEVASSVKADTPVKQELKLKNQVSNADVPKVFFTKDVSPEGLMKVYKALNQKQEGKVGIKVSFGAENEQYLDPKLMTELVKVTQGTFLDTCGFTPPRDTPEGNLRAAKDHGFTQVAPVDVLDKDGDVDMPVRGGYHLKYARTGAHLNNYGTLIAVHRFKGHYLPIYGGNIKNISLSLGSLSGKAIIHSAGKNESSYESRDEKTTAEAFADAAKAAMEFKKDRWAFINVMDSFDPKDGCKGVKNLGNIGIIASLDPVAIDQASCDFVYGTAADAKQREEWEKYHSTSMLEYAEKIGVGKRQYQLVNLD